LGNNMNNIYSTNIKITKNIIKFASKNNVKIIFFLSSIAVYGLPKKKLFQKIKNHITQIYMKNQNFYQKNFFVKKIIGLKQFVSEYLVFLL